MGLLMPLRQLRRNLGGSQPARGQQDEGVIGQIRHLLDQALVILRQRRHHHLGPLLAHLLRDLRQARIEQAGRVRFLGGVLLAVLNYVK